jgi:Zn finger protein HypA/HybF involved in hydrogenase expression
MEKKILEELLNSGLTVLEISNEVGKSQTSVRYWIEKHGLKANGRKRKWAKEDILIAIKSSLTVADVLRKLGLQVRPGNYRTVRKFASENNIDLSHLEKKATGRGKAHGKGGIKKKSLSDILIEGSTYNRCHLKSRLLKEGILKNKCSECGLSETWNGKEIKMVLDHINGVNDDNRIDNLQMLCPNCNSQQATFCRGQLSFIKSRHPDEFAKQEESKINKCNCGKAIEYRSSQCNKCASVENGK